MENNIILNNNNIIERNLNYNELIEKFLNYIDVSKETYNTYKRSLRQFYKYICENGITQPTRDTIISFKNSLISTNKPNTINLYLTSVKCFYKWLEYENITKDITKNIKGIKIGRTHLKQAFTIEQIQKLMNNTKDTREKLLLTLGVTLGLRANEMANIRLEDFKQKQDKICLYVLGKGKDTKEDFVVVPNNVFDLIKEYCEEYNINDYLFTSTSNHNNGGGVTTTTLRRIINDLYERCDLKDSEHTLHSTRHSSASISIQNGSDIREVSKFLRHSNTSTTEIYLHDMEEINNTCSNIVSNILFN